MRVRFRLLPALLLASTIFTAMLARADDASQADLLARLAAAHEATNLTDPALKPWHMLTTFDLLDPKGSVTEHGTFEEWWAAPDRFHQRISSPGYDLDLFTVGSQSFASSSKPVPYLLRAMIKQLTDPLPTTESHPYLTQQNRSLGNVSLDCLLVQSRAQKEAPLPGRVPTDCFDPKTSRLRAVMSSDIQTITRNTSGVFQGKLVDLDVDIFEAGHPLLHASVGQLQTQTVVADDPNLTPPLAMPIASLPVEIAIGSSAPKLLNHPAAAYPDALRHEEISGAVLITATVGADGKTHSPEVVWSANPNLTKVALDAVLEWTYQPYLVNYQPTEFQMTVVLTFSIAH